jgi:hypothetical protein
MSKKTFVLAGLLTLAALSYGTFAQAQLPRFSAPYRPPAGNPLPSQLNFFRRDSGLLDPYNGIVAPQQRLNQDLRSLNYRQRQLQAEINAPAQYRDPGVAPTGTGSVFMNRSHFFPTTQRR